MTRLPFPKVTAFSAGFLAACALLLAAGTRPGAAPGVRSMRPLEAPRPFPQDGKLRIIAFGAHPDDCELDMGGTAAKWAAAGHHVKFVAVTNGDIGHWKMAGGALAKRRLAEVRRCAEILGLAETEVLDIHDGELMPTLENRKTIVRLIREWQADVVLSHRPNDYHPDHRYTGVLLQDAAFMVTVPFFCPDTPRLTRNPVFMYFHDRFQKPSRFEPDIAVATDDMLAKKLECVDAMPSQFFEGGAGGSGGRETGSESLLNLDAAGRERRRKQVHAERTERFTRPANDARDLLVRAYGEKGRSVRTAESFELCEYGHRASKEDLTRLFPFVPFK